MRPVQTFAMGQRVRLTAACQQAFPTRRPRVATGVVLGHVLSQPGAVRVRRDGVAAPDVWHATLLEPVDGAGAEGGR